MLAIFLAGCISVPVEIGRQVTRVDPTKDTPMTGVGVESNDLNAVADKMVRSMLTVSAIARAKNPPTVALLPVKNKTRFAINQDLFLKLNLNLLDLRMPFVVVGGMMVWLNNSEGLQLLLLDLLLG